MTSNPNRLARKDLLLPFALGMMAAASAVTRPPLAYCPPRPCLFSPPTHWNNIACRGVCDCPNKNGSCER